MKTKKTRACFKLTLSVEVEISGTEFFEPSPRVLEEINKLDLETLTEEEVIEGLIFASTFSNNDWGHRVSVNECDLVDKFDPTFHLSRENSRKLKYLRKYLPSEITAIVNQILVKESIVHDAYRAANDAGAKIKKGALKYILKETEKRIRKRIPSRVGRPRIRETFNYVNDKIAFAERCFEAMDAIEKAGKKLTKQNLAEHLFPDDIPGKAVLDPVKALRTQLRKYEITFAQLMGSYTGKGPESISTVEDMLAQVDRYIQYKDYWEI